MYEKDNGEYPAVVTLTDNAMYVYSKALNELGLEDMESSGASWNAFLACTHKVFCRDEIDGAGDVKYKPVTAQDLTVPNVGNSDSDDVIVKPALGISSLNITKTKPGLPNPFYQNENPCNMIFISDQAEKTVIPEDMLDQIGRALESRQR